VNGRTASGLFASWVALAVFLLAPPSSLAATSLPKCDGVVLDKGPTLFPDGELPRAAAAGLGIPGIDLPGLDPPDIPLPDVLPDGLELIDGADLGDEVLCVTSTTRRGDADSASAERKKRGCKGAKKPAFKSKGNQARKAVLCLIDKARRRRGKGDLKPNGSLKASSKRHSSKMVNSGCFAHQCNGEPPLPSRVTRTGYLPCNCAWSVGENLAYGKGSSSAPAAIVAAWLKSPPHKAVMLGGYNHADVGVLKGAPGNRNFTGATFTINFGAKR
jgi:uncharacterized protein YkwD